MIQRMTDKMFRVGSFFPLSALVNRQIMNNENFIKAKRAEKANVISAGYTYSSSCIQCIESTQRIQIQSQAHSQLGFAARDSLMKMHPFYRKVFRELPFPNIILDFAGEASGKKIISPYHFE